MLVEILEKLTRGTINLIWILQYVFIKKFYFLLKKKQKWSFFCSKIISKQGNTVLVKVYGAVKFSKPLLRSENFSVPGNMNKKRG